jgi:hypothetical protein
VAPPFDLVERGGRGDEEDLVEAQPPIRFNRWHASSGEQISETWATSARLADSGRLRSMATLARTALLPPASRLIWGLEIGPAAVSAGGESRLGKGAGIGRLVAFGRHRRDRTEIGVEGQRNAAAEPGAAAVHRRRDRHRLRELAAQHPEILRDRALADANDQVDRHDIARLGAALDNRRRIEASTLQMFYHV